MLEGAGKTSLTRNVGCTLGQARVRTLPINLGSQASLTPWLGVHNTALDETVHGVIGTVMALLPARAVRRRSDRQPPQCGQAGDGNAGGRYADRADSHLAQRARRPAGRSGRNERHIRRRALTRPRGASRRIYHHWRTPYPRYSRPTTVSLVRLGHEMAGQSAEVGVTARPRRRRRQTAQGHRHSGARSSPGQSPSASGALLGARAVRPERCPGRLVRADLK
ncbi:hypothetical protein SAMN00790413_05680 [Deinococcus hopiensis KR-140]|uniref:Uncharacterized protein n=1 Tax=Deinococcus hopiensis KR-140 TaxID=695939 RepID=A0A1W1UCW3_9DEIO|nr:hypothetical protein SAMN00790413_05680 [Deinococcus hopiensis KR-140]